MAPKARNLAGAAERANNIVALLEYKPGPGIYSRLERAVQQLPENVRVQELPGLLKRYKDGIPGWELKAVDLESVAAGRKVVPRDELLAAVRERSPVFTHKNVVLRGGEGKAAGMDPSAPPLAQLGGEGRHGDPKWRNYGLGGSDYQERLLVQPEDPFPGTRGQWQRDRMRNHFVGDYGGNVAAHLRTDRNADALRIVELQSDIQNQARRAADPDLVQFPSSEYWQELQLKSALLDAARGGYRAVEVADPEDVSRAVGFPAEKSEKYYGGIIPQLLERQGKKLGGWESTSRPRNDAIYDDASKQRDYYANANSIENQEKAAALEDRILGIAGTEDIHLAEEMLKDNPSILDGSSLPDEAKQEIQQYLAYAEQRGAIWDNTGAEDFYSARDVLQDPNWRQQYGFNGLEASRVGELRRKLGLEDSVGFDPNLRGEMGTSEVALRYLDDSSENILNNIQRKIMQEVDGTDRTIWQATSGNSDNDLRMPQLPQDAEVRLQGLIHAIQTAGEARATVAGQRIDPRGILAERASGQELHARLEQLIGKDRTDRLLPAIMGDIEQYGQMRQSIGQLQDLQEKIAATQKKATPSGWRGVMSDEMRRRIINEGIPAAVALGVGTGIATGGNDAQAAPRLPMSDDVLRAAMPRQTQQQIAKLGKQVEAAYAKGDYAKAEKLDAKWEQLVEEWDNKLEQMDEGDGNADMEPENYDQDTAWTDEMANIYGRAAVAQSPSYAIESQADLADALRGALPDTARANAISDEDIIAYAKGAFDQRQAHLAKVRSATPEDGVRAMQARLRDLGAGALPAPIMGQAQSVNENRELPAGSGGSWEDLRRGAVGDFDFSMAISPEEWENYYQNTGMSVEHQKFKQNVAEVLGQPIIRVGAANDAQLLVDGDAYDRITPAQFVGEYLDIYAPKLDDVGRAQVLERVVAKLDGSTRAPDVMADDIVGRMMGSLQASSPNGKYAKVDPMPQEQFDALKQQYGGWAESMLTPGTAENFESLRGYELLRTTLDGQHAPVYADNLSNAAAFVGGFVSPKAREDFADATFQSGPEGRFRRANRDYFSSRSRPDEPAAFRDPEGTSRFASTSATNIPGLVRAGSDVSNTIGAISWPLYESFSEFTRTPVGKAVTGEGLPALWEGWGDSQFMADKRQAFDREQPIQPAGMSREQFDQQLASHKRDREEGEGWGATTFPNAQAALDKIAGANTKKTWGPPLYNDYGPNFFQNTVGNIPSVGIMAGTAATGGLLGGLAGAVTPKAGMARAAAGAAGGVVRGAARGAGAAAASQAADVPFDFATDQAVGSALGGGPQNYIGYITTPEENNALLPGVDPSSMSIDELNRRRDDALREREQRFKDNMWNWSSR